MFRSTRKVLGLVAYCRITAAQDSQHNNKYNCYYKSLVVHYFLDATLLLHELTMNVRLLRKNK